MSPPMLSVVLPNYNHAEFVGDAVEAILAQDYEPLELVIVDDGSTDHSRAVLGALAERHPQIRLILNERNRGVKHSVRLGFGATTGSYVYTAAADDRVLPGFFRTALELAERHPEAAYVFGNIVARYPDGSTKEFGASRWDEPRYASPDEFRSEYLEAEAPSHSLSGATIYRRDALEAMIPWHLEALGAWSDTFRLRALGLLHGVCYVPVAGVLWRVAPDTLSQTLGSQPRRAYDIAASAAHLMRSPHFRERFPEEHVARWLADYRASVRDQQVYAFQRGMNEALGVLQGSAPDGGAVRSALGRLIGVTFKGLRWMGSRWIRLSLERYPGRVPAELAAPATDATS